MVITERSIRFKAKSIEEFLSRYPYIPKDIMDKYQDGDEIWHHDDFGIAPSRCEREAVLLVRNDDIIESHVIRKS